MFSEHSAAAVCTATACSSAWPGIVIFVHGVNADGEWYRAAEEGLCKGLNTRM